MSDDRLFRIENKIDKVCENISHINVTLGEHGVILKDHIRRSLANEKAVKVLEASQNRLYGALKLLLILSSLAGIVETIKLIKGLV